MADNRITVLVTGSTGNQGSAVARHLLASGKVNVRCLVRNPNGRAAIELQNKGAQLAQGDFDDSESLRKALNACYVLFLNPLPGADGVEIRQTQNVLAAAKEAGVMQVVCSTVCRASESEDFVILKKYPNPFMLNYWKEKAAVETLVKTYREGDQQVSWTLLQPAWLMSNFIAPVAPGYWGERLGKEGVLVTAFDKDTMIQLSSGDDVGACACAAILAFLQGNQPGNPYARQVIRPAGDELTIEQIAAAMSEVSGRQLKVEYLSQDQVEEEVYKSPVVYSQLWAKLDGAQVDMGKMGDLGLKTPNFKSFLKQNEEALKQAVDA